jgi:RimJ/RimL family protein N-acetyltransferase
VWRLTGESPSNLISYETELEWINTALARSDEKRFAICINDEKKYVGNVQLTCITSRSAEFHIFIGDPSLYGMGIGTKATSLILSYAHEILSLKEVFLYVHPENKAAIQIYEKCRFILIDSDDPIRLKYLYKL